VTAETTVWKFPPKTQLQQKERTKAVAWATAKVGGWRGPNVTASIQKYLADAGFKVDQAHIRNSMVYLVERDLAIQVVIGRRTREFIMAPDVELEEPDFVRAQRARAAGHGPTPEPVRLPAAPPATNGHASPVIDDHGSRPMPGVEVVPRTAGPAGTKLPGRGRGMPRLPSAMRQEPAQLDLLVATLRAWHDRDADACDLWVAAVLRDLGVEQ
jgi:hypothetical protein